MRLRGKRWVIRCVVSILHSEISCMILSQSQASTPPVLNNVLEPIYESLPDILEVMITENEIDSAV